MKRLLPLVVLLASACDSATPVAPTGTVLSISASPALIAVNGASLITIIATRSTGQPVNPRTQIRLSTTLGSIPEVVETDDAGAARAFLVGTGRAGVATVTASSGAAEAKTVDVTIGIEAEELTLSATPSTLPAGGGSVNLRALARDEDGEPLAGAPVVFTATVGTLGSRGTVVRTDASGVAHDRLTVTSSELATVSGNSVRVRADAGTASAELEIPIQPAPG